MNRYKLIAAVMSFISSITGIILGNRLSLVHADPDVFSISGSFRCLDLIPQDFISVGVRVLKYDSTQSAEYGCIYDDNGNYPILHIIFFENRSANWMKNALDCSDQPDCVMHDTMVNTHPAVVLARTDETSIFIARQDLDTNGMIEFNCEFGSKSDVISSRKLTALAAKLIP